MTSRTIPVALGLLAFLALGCQADDPAIDAPAGDVAAVPPDGEPPDGTSAIDSQPADATAPDGPPPVPLGWSIRLGGDGYDSAEALAFNPAGDLFVAGVYTGPADLGGEGVPSVGNGQDVFVARFSPDGELVWVRTIGGAQGDGVAGLAVDGAGDVVVAGSFSQACDFGGETRASVGWGDAFVARYRGADGILLDLFTSGSEGDEYLRAMALDATGDVVLAGSFAGTVTLGGTTFAGEGYADIFVARLGPTLEVAEAFVLGSALDDHAESIVADPAGGIVLAGRFAGPLTLGGAVHECAGEFDGFAVSYSAMGVERWSRVFSTPGDDCVSGVALGADGEVVVGGFLSGSVDLGDGFREAYGFRDAFLAGYAADGAFRAAVTFGSAVDEKVDGVAIAGDGDIVATGTFTADMSMGGPLLENQGSFDLFVARFSPAGLLEWGHGYGGSGYERPEALAVSGVRVAIAGLYSGGPLDFGTGELAPGLQEAFVAVVEP